MCSDLLDSFFLLLQMAPLEQQQVADCPDLSRRLDMPQVDLPPEENSVNLTQLVPELELIGEKGKDKKDESDEEVRLTNRCEMYSRSWLIITHTTCMSRGSTFMFLYLTDAFHFNRKRKVKLEIKIKRRKDGTREPSRCYTAFRYINNFVTGSFQQDKAFDHGH